MGVMPYHVRMAELWTLSKRRMLTDMEAVELNHCMAANAKYCWDLVALQNMSLAAYMVGDMEWLHEVCAQIDALGEDVKKPGK